MSTDSAHDSIAIVMLTLNEAHNLPAVLDNIEGWADEIFVVDSSSTDDTISIALQRGVHVVQRAFRGFGDQWNFSLKELPVTAAWTMKLDPDERLTDELKQSIRAAIQGEACDGYSLVRRLWFMCKPMPVKQTLMRVWRTGNCQFSDVVVNEYPLVSGTHGMLNGILEHHDSPNLEHWLDKQNRYTTLEADMAARDAQLSVEPRLLGNSLEQRMWLKRHFGHLPLRFTLLFFYNWLVAGAWRAGRAGYIWSRLRSDIMRLIEYKRYEIELTGTDPYCQHRAAGRPDARVPQYDREGKLVRYDG